MAGARSLALGGCGLTFTDVHAAWSNPAGLAEVQTLSASAYTEQRFLLSELRAVGAAVAVPAGAGAFALTTGFFGFSAYSEQRLGLAYARRLFEGLHVGGQFIGLNTSIEGYGSRFLLTFELGVHGRISRVLWLAARVLGPVRVAIRPDQYLPTALHFGLRYEVATTVHLLAELEKDIRFPARVRTGLEYRPVSALHLRLGLATQPSLVTFGAGYHLRAGVRVDVAVQYHQFLGFSPAVGLVYEKTAE